MQYRKAVHFNSKTGKPLVLPVRLEKLLPSSITYEMMFLLGGLTAIKDPKEEYMDGCKNLAHSRYACKYMQGNIKVVEGVKQRRA